jgi:16S rRNA (cytosine1402-N4)-methyltransferase
MHSRPAAHDPLRHRPVMLAEVMAALAPRDNAIYVDGTFGGGGYTEAILERAQTHVYAIDRDPDAIRAGAALATRFAGRLTLIEGPFSSMPELLKPHGVNAVDGIVLDIGVSSMQLGDPQRGFSFMSDGPLDMRMSRTGATAAEIVNAMPEAELARIIAKYGEERRARAVARAIVSTRKGAPLTRTRELVALLERVVGRPRPDKIHPATRTFQALRIYVNDELGELERALEASEALLNTGGRLVIVSFHSLEDRIVKRFLAERSGRAARPSRHAPMAGPGLAPSFEPLTRGAARPSLEESDANPRARSARLRAAVRTDAPARSRQARSEQAGTGAP